MVSWRYFDKQQVWLPRALLYLLWTRPLISLVFPKSAVAHFAQFSVSADKIFKPVIFIFCSRIYIFWFITVGCFCGGSILWTSESIEPKCFTSWSKQAGCSCWALPHLEDTLQNTHNKVIDFFILLHLKYNGTHACWIVYLLHLVLTNPIITLIFCKTIAWMSYRLMLKKLLQKFSALIYEGWASSNGECGLAIHREWVLYWS